MKQILVEIDDRCARDLERVAPARARQRAEFVRLAIRRAIDIALDRSTEAAYRESLLPMQGASSADLAGWDPLNRLAKTTARTRRRGRRAKRAA